MSTVLLSDFQEDYPMTFQLGIAADGGVLLASDRLLVNMNGVRLPFQAPKIIVHEKLGFAHCSAGDSFCETLTKMVRNELETGTTDLAEGETEAVMTSLENCVKQARTEEAAYVKKTGGVRFGARTVECVGGTTLLVFRGKNSVSLWKIDTLRPYPIPTPVEPGNCVVSGDTNPAVFFAKHYFPKVSLDLSAMMRLAAHTVLMAKSDNVEGLQIGVFTQKRFGLLTDQELNPYIALSDEIDSEILKRLQTMPRKGADTGTRQ